MSRAAYRYRTSSKKRRPSTITGGRRFTLTVAAVFVLAFAATLWVSEGPRGSIPASLAIPREASLYDLSCRVASITDGDTLRCADGIRIRLHAVAARESDGTCSSGHPCPAASAQRARDTLRDLAAGQTLRCIKTGTSYNRVTAICDNEAGVEINCAMVQSGAALKWGRFDRQRPICR